MTHLSIFRHTLIFVFSAICTLAFATTVRMETNQGNIDVELYDNEAPKTVANFLGYVRSKAYDSSFFHRSIPGFIIQGGGYVFKEGANGSDSIVSGPPVQNEFSPSRSNVRGTIAMAKLGGNPNSATSEWFFNLANNGSNLDNQNGGFTVFGKVTDASLTVLDKIAGLRIINAGGAFTDLPLSNPSVTNSIVRSDLVLINSVKVLGSSTVPEGVTGLWWNANESGWGMSLTQRGNIIFAAIYTYDDAGKPLWYVISRCEVVQQATSRTCTGDVQAVTDGAALTQVWSSANLKSRIVGSGTITISSATTGTLNMTVDGKNRTRFITPYLFGANTSNANFNSSDLWWNKNESGWGMSLTQSNSVIFAAMYTYATDGKPIWYVMSECAVSNSAGVNSCKGDIFRVAGGSAINVAWSGTAVSTKVGAGTITFDSTSENATFDFTIDGVTSKKAITRFVF